MHFGSVDASPFLMLLNEDEDSATFRVTQLQLKYPTKGDWVSTCVQNLKQLEIKKKF